jgi:hypothetical protein
MPCLTNINEFIRRYNFAIVYKMRTQTILLIVLAVAIVGFFIARNREGLKWDRGFAGFRPAVSGVITEGSLDIEGSPVVDVSIKAMMIQKIATETAKKIFDTKGLSMFPIETVFIQVFNTPESIGKLKENRPDVYDAYIKYLQTRQTQDLEPTEDDNKKVRSSLISYLNTLKRDQDYASPPDGVPMTYRARFLMLDTTRFYGSELDVIAIGDGKDVTIQGITSQPLMNGDERIKPFQDSIKAGEWEPYNTIANSNAPTKSALELAENAIKDKWGEDFKAYEVTATADVGQFEPVSTPYLR